MISKIKLRGQQGMTFVEVVVLLIIISILSTIVGYVYINYTAKTQMADALNSLDQLRTDVFHSISNDQGCITEHAIQGLVGSATVSGSPIIKSLTQSDIASTGCILKYTFSEKSSPVLKDKIATLVLMNNGQLYTNLDGTTLPLNLLSDFPLYTVNLSPTIPVFGDPHPTNPTEHPLPNLPPIIETDIQQ